ncbi:MAG: hypothetical protein ACHQ1D_11240, partial [Nitrososphaerales archaeon]
MTRYQDGILIEAISLKYIIKFKGNKMFKFYTMTFCLIFLFTTISSAQTTYYVSESGSNSNNGLTPQTAFATLQFTANMVSAGDSVLVMEGNYVGFDIRTDGNQNSPIVFKALENNVV